MTPLKKFGGWVSMNQWGLGFGLDVTFDGKHSCVRIWIVVGPLNGVFDSSGEW